MSKQHGLVILFSLLAATEGTDCPDGWLSFDCSCYLFPDTPARFWEAVHYCQIHGGNLIHVDSDMENDFIKNYLRGLRRPNELYRDWWLGLTDELVEGHWRWLDTNTQATFFDWAPNEPNVMLEDCAALEGAKDFQWVDVLCNRDDIFPLCEMSGAPGLQCIVG